MAHKKKPGAPIPPGNRPQNESGKQNDSVPSNSPDNQNNASGAAFDQEDPKRRQGDYQNEAQHSIQQPDGKKGSDH